MHSTWGRYYYHYCKAGKTESKPKSVIRGQRIADKFLMTAVTSHVYLLLFSHDCLYCSPYTIIFLCSTLFHKGFKEDNWKSWRKMIHIKYSILHFCFLEASVQQLLKGGKRAEVTRLIFPIYIITRSARTCEFKVISTLCVPQIFIEECSWDTQGPEQLFSYSWSNLGE